MPLCNVCCGKIVYIQQIIFIYRERILKQVKLMLLVCKNLRANRFSVLHYENSAAAEPIVEYVKCVAHP